jgi:putative heme-binding domain-containing protein
MKTQLHLDKMSKPSRKRKQAQSGAAIVRERFSTGLSIAVVLLFVFVAFAFQTCAQEAPDGEAIFNQSCAGCHGMEGAGGRGPSLRGQLRHGNQKSDIVAVVSNGLPGTGMPKFSFEKNDLDALVTYVQSLSRASETTPHRAGDVAAGKQIYETHGCSGCHKIGNDGSAFGPNLTRIGAARSYDYLKTSILHPSADVPENYQGITIITRDGKRYSGVRVNEDSFTVQVRLPNQQFMSFDKQAVQQEIPAKKSPMPAYQLSGSDLNNLLAYLGSLAGSPNGSTGTTEEPRLR